MLFLELAAVAAGIGLLVWGADKFVHYSSIFARNLGVSPLVIGLSVVAFGTSAPELMVSGVAAFQGNRDIGIGNAVGSNITNIALVLGATALFSAVRVQTKVFRLEYPLLLINTLFIYVLLVDGDFNRTDGLMLLLMLALDTYLITRSALANRTKLIDDDQAPMGPTMIWLLVGLVVLLISSEMLVWGAELLAKRIGVSDLVIGLTVVAFGTSLPELAASLTAAVKKEHGMAIGNIIGSNIFNISAVLAMPALIHPGEVEPHLMQRDYWIMAALTLAIPVLGYAHPKHRGRITRHGGVLLLAAFVAYYTLLYLSHS